MNIIDSHKTQMSQMHVLDTQIGLPDPHKPHILEIILIITYKRFIIKKNLTKIVITIIMK